MGLSNKKNWKEKGLKVVNAHNGKKKVYKNYEKVNPGMAEKYLRFLAKQPDALYITWDKDKGRFVA